MAEALQPLDAASLVGAIPIANRVVVQQQRRCDTLAAPTPIEKDNGVRPAAHAMLRKSIPSKPGQGSPVISREKSAANHIPRRILFVRDVKQLLGFSINRRIATNLLLFPVSYRLLPEPSAQIAFRKSEARLQCLFARPRLRERWRLTM